MARIRLPLTVPVAGDVGERMRKLGQMPGAVLLLLCLRPLSAELRQRIFEQIQKSLRTECEELFVRSLRRKRGSSMGTSGFVAFDASALLEASQHIHHICL